MRCLVLSAAVLGTTFLYADDASELAAKSPQIVFGDDFDQSQANSAFKSTGVFSSGSQLVVVPESKDAIIALGPKGWFRQELDKQDGLEILPIIGASCVALRYADEVFAFSGQAGRWESVKVKPDSDAMPVVGSSRVTVKDGDLYHAFVLEAGRWSTVNLRTGEVVGR